MNATTSLPRSPLGEHPAIEGRVLELVTALVAELEGEAPARPVTPGSLLDRDLGLGSLERVELLVRLEQEFRVRLPDAVIAEAERVSDLAWALGAAAPAAPEVPQETAARVVEPGVPAPAATDTLTAALRWHAEAHPARVHILLREDDGSERRISYGDLWDQTVAIAAGLRSRGLGRGDTVALMLRTEAAFFPAFFGVLLAGSVPVPMYPPFRADRIEEYATRQVKILENAQARLLVTFGEATRVARLLRPRVPPLHAVVTPEQLAQPGAVATPVWLHPADPALIQHTSGSTGDPKGVLLSHANILANIRAIGEAIGVRPDDIGVSWLPLYHDMGLIGSWLAALYFGVPIVIFSPLAFLARPARWLHAIHAHRATVSPAPNFAFDLCVRKVTDDEIENLDLSSWRLAFNGSEPVSPETIERFTRRFAPHGFRPEAMCPVYGLAEATVALTVPALGQRPRIDLVGRARFERAHEASRAVPGEPAPLRFVSCGRPLPGHAVRVVDTDGRPVPDRVEGHVWFRGPSVTAGYFRNPEATRAVRHDGWMDSGDLGYWAGGELFITGRRKDVIIKAGRNLYPQEVEAVVGDVAGIRKGCVAAFGVPDPAIGTERLVVVAETREPAPAMREHLRSATVERIAAAMGLPPDVVVMCGPGAVLKTPSGKIRRGAVRDAYLAGTLGAPRRAPAAQWTRLALRAARARARGVAGDLLLLALAGRAGSLLALTLPVLWGLVRLLPAGRAVDWAVRLWCRLALALGGCRLRVEGLGHLRGLGPAVLAVNHASYLDAVVLLAAVPVDFRFVAKRELATVPLVGDIIRKAGHLTVERLDLSRSVADAERVVAALRGGTSVLVFPEGTFRRTPGLLPFRLGAFKAAVEAERPVVPVAIRGTRDILPADAWVPRPGPITIRIGPPIFPARDGWAELVRLRDHTRVAISHGVEESAAEVRATSL